MPTVEAHINRINTKLQDLVRRYGSLMKDNEQKSKTIAGLEAQRKASEDRIIELEQQATVLKAACGSLDAKDKKEFEQTISKYLRDIDKCITLLSE